MLRLADCDDPLIGRPLALYDTVPDLDGQPAAIDVVYLVAGKMTSYLARCGAGQALDVWGPLGNGFSQSPVDHLIMVAGGIGHTPLLALAQQILGKKTYGSVGNGANSIPARLAGRVTLCYGAKDAGYLSGIEDFKAAGVEVRLATDNGSAGRHGFVTDLLRESVQEEAGSVRVACCGPEPMMEAVAEITNARRVPCEVSLETPMACGIGICFTCVARVRQEDGSWDYKRTCVDGPVFAAENVCW